MAVFQRPVHPPGGCFYCVEQDLHDLLQNIVSPIRGSISTLSAFWLRSKFFKGELFLLRFRGETRSLALHEALLSHGDVLNDVKRLILFLQNRRHETALHERVTSRLAAVTSSLRTLHLMAALQKTMKRKCRSGLHLSEIQEIATLGQFFNKGLKSVRKFSRLCAGFWIPELQDYRSAPAACSRLTNSCPMIRLQAQLDWVSFQFHGLT